MSEDEAARHLTAVGWHT